MRAIPAWLTEAILLRDGGICAMCGRAARWANHRADRGQGGYLAGDRPSNLCAICGECNDRLESDADFAEEARRRGVKISKYDDPEKIRYLSPLFQMLVYLHDDWTLDFVLDEEDAAGQNPAASESYPSTKEGIQL